MKSQFVLRHALMQCLLHLLGVLLSLKEHDEVVRVADELCLASESGNYLPFKPDIQRIVQAHVT
jgi:hypothetical protein